MWATLAVKAVAAGTLVCVFALIGELLRPKQFAGLFSAAPSVALASLAVTSWMSGPSDLLAYLLGMAAGGVGFIAYALAAGPTVRYLGAATGSALSALVWFGVAGTLYLVALR
jgi:hypothetical protein